MEGEEASILALCDGEGWSDVPGYDGSSYNTRVYAIEGSPPSHSFVHLPQFPDLLTRKPPEINRYYGFGIIALGNRIYHFLSTPNRPFGEPDPRFVGVKPIYSPDLGATWRGPYVIDEVIGSYPSMVELADGTIFCVYYEEGEGSSIRAARFRARPDAIDFVRPE